MPVDPTLAAAPAAPVAAVLPPPPSGGPPEQEIPGDGVGPAPAPAKERRARRDRKAGRRLRVAGTLMVVIGLIGLGCLGGWWVRGRKTPPPTKVTKVTVDRPIVNVEGIAEDGAMPSLTGLSETDAREALFQFGLTAESVTVKLVPAAGQEGLVIGQDPIAGTTNPEAVTIEVSKAADVPALTGKSEAEAREVLADLGAQVTVEERYDPSNPAEGTVLETTPAAGEPLIDEVTVVVSTPPSSVFATQIEPIDSGCGTYEASVDGRHLDEALVCSVSAGSEDPTIQEWVINRDITAMTFSLGQDDAGTTGFRLTARVYADDTLIKEGAVDFGSTTAFDVPINQAIRLRIELSASATECCESVDGVLVDARFLGSPDAIDELIEASGG